MKLFQVLAVASIFVAATSGTATIDPSLKQRFLGDLGNTQNVMVSFTQSIDTVIQQINRMNFSSIQEKRTALTNAQQAFTASSQQPLQTFLNRAGVNYESFWISNSMVVPNAPSSLVSAISNVPGVAKIEKEPQIPVNIPFMGEVEEIRNLTRQARQTSLSWGVQRIEADKVWGQYKGKGVVVANIDTGVRYTHQTLRNNWRSSYGWYDPYSKSRTPNDGNGHGTHTMGTIAGSNGIGVAPEASWIACMGCNSRTCGGSQLLSCGQWVQCPTDTQGNNKNCNMAPDVVSNSWGGGQGQSWYDNVVKSWRAAEIIPVFSIGNSGPDCGSANSPGDRPNLISVGSTESDDRISSFSSLGPASNGGYLKPEIAAPGGQIRSAWHTSDTAYNTISGTSMACPHVSGVVALLLQKDPTLDYDEVFDAITKGAVTAIKSNNAKTCGGKSGTSFPNNVYGSGILNALNSVNRV